MSKPIRTRLRDWSKLLLPTWAEHPFPAKPGFENLHAAAVHAKANQVGARSGLQAAQPPRDSADARGIGGGHSDGLCQADPCAVHYIADGAIHAQAGSGQTLASAKSDTIVFSQFYRYAAQHVGSRWTQGGRGCIGHQDAAVNPLGLE